MTGALLVGVGCAAFAGWLLGAGGSARPASAEPPPGWWPPSLRGGLVRPSRAVVLVAAAGLVVWIADGVAVDVAVAVPLACAVGVAGSTAVWLRRRAEEHRRARTLAADVVEACEALAAGLRAGLAPERVLASASKDLPVLRSAATAERVGGDVPTSLRAAAAAPGADRLEMLAAAWEVAGRSGAGLAEAVARIAAAVRADQGRSRAVDAALAGARSTARLFAVLPVLGVALGTGMGAAPMTVLTTSPACAWCMCVGTVLAATGLVWVERLAGAVR